MEMVMIDALRTDGGTQPRAGLNRERVEQYAERYRNGEAMPPVKVMDDGEDFWLYDGFHRVAAAALAEFEEIEAELTEGTREDAIWASLAANKEHDRSGLYRTNEDKRRAVEKALELHPEYGDVIIAEHVGVHANTVKNIAKGSQIVRPAARVGRDGKTYTLPPPPMEPLTVPPPPPTVPPPSGPPPAPHSGPVAPTEPFPDSPTDNSPSARPEQPPRMVVRDSIGREVPERCLTLWQRRGEPREMQNGVSKYRCALKKAQDDKDPLYSAMNFSHAIAHLDQAFEAMKAAIPYAVCPYCHGSGCRMCHDTGLVSKYHWDHACAKEFKDAAIAEGQGHVAAS